MNNELFSVCSLCWFVEGLVHLHFVNLKYIVLKLGMKSRNCTICIQCKNIDV